MARTLVAQISPTDGKPFDSAERDDIVECFVSEGWTDVRVRGPWYTGSRPRRRPEYLVTADAAVDPYVS